MILGVKFLEEFNDTYSLISIKKSISMTNLLKPNFYPNKILGYLSRLLLRLTFDK